LAIGKDGRNVRLAANLTGWKIDIKGGEVGEAQEEEESSSAEASEGEEKPKKKSKKKSKTEIKEPGETKE
jgi:N utilization substance protein A